MAQMIGALEAFDVEVTSWTAWATRFDFYCSLNNVTDDDRKRQLLSLMIGGQTFKLLTDLISPSTIDSRTPEELLTTLDAYFTPKKLVIAERFKFYQRTQLEGESVTQYLAALRNLAKDCNFGQWLPEALRDKIVLGLRSEAVQRRLLGEEHLDLSKAVDLATSMEAATRDSRELNRPMGSVNQLERRDKQRTSARLKAVSKCSRCNGDGHDAYACRYRDAVCHQCGKTGHISRACRSDADENDSSESECGQTAKQSWKSRKPTGRQHHVEEKSDSDIGHVEGDSADLPGKLLLSINVDGNPHVFEVDTGAAVTLISEVTWLSLGRPKLRHCSLKLTRYGKPMLIMGWCDMNVTYMPSGPVILSVIVIKGEGSSLLGLNWIYRLNIQLDRLLIQANVCADSQVVASHRVNNDVLSGSQSLFSEEERYCRDTVAELVMDST